MRYLATTTASNALSSLSLSPPHPIPTSSTGPTTLHRPLRTFYADLHYIHVHLHSYIVYIYIYIYNWHIAVMLLTLLLLRMSCNA